MNKENKRIKIDNNYLYQGEYKQDTNKVVIYDGYGYLFNYNTKCFFKGQFEAGKKVQGIETFPNGDVFEGNYVDEKFNGMGCLYNLTLCDQGKYKYEGNFENGKKNGKGKETYPAGSYYEGDFKNNMKHGQGIFCFPDGSYFEGDFVKGLPNGFGIHVAYQKERITTIFPVFEHHQKIYSEKQKIEVNEKDEYSYEGDFVDGLKHGIGRLVYPDGSFIYAVWEYNKPCRHVVYYNAQKNVHYVQPRNKNLELQNLNEINFFINIENLIVQQPSQGQNPSGQNGYPAPSQEAYKQILDSKGLKEEFFQDPEFDLTDVIITPKDENSIPMQGVQIEIARLYKLKEFKSNKKHKLFVEPISHNSIIYKENYYTQFSCYQLISVIDALAYTNFIFQKVFTRKYDFKLGYYTLKLYLNEEWQEIVIDDQIPIYSNNERPIFVNTEKQEIGWIILQKAIAKLEKTFEYFDQREITVPKYLNMLTGLPCQILELKKYRKMEDLKNDESKEKRGRAKLWRKLHEKNYTVNQEANFNNSTKLAYLQKDFCQKQGIPINYPFIILDTIQLEHVKLADEDKWLLLKSINSAFSLSSDVELMNQNRFDKSQTAQIQKLKDKFKVNKEDLSYFMISLKEFMEMFEEICLVVGIYYTISNSVLIKPEPTDIDEQEIKSFIRFEINYPQSLLLQITQLNDLMFPIEKNKLLPLRIVLTREKDEFSNKIQMKKSMARHMRGQKEDAEAKYLEEKHQQELASHHTFEIQKTEEKHQEVLDFKKGVLETRKITTNKPINLYRYILGKGQKIQQYLNKETILEAGIYVLMIQVELPNEHSSIKVNPSETFFKISLHSQGLINLNHVNTIPNFQKIAYETAIGNAEKYQAEENKDPPYFTKSDLSERENGSSDLVICQYYLKSEGTYLQMLKNKSNNKIWRQKLYFKTENMKILDQTDNQKVDLQLNRKQNALVIIQQVKGLQYRLEGGEGICIIDIVKDKNEEDQKRKQKEELQNQKANEKDQSQTNQIIANNNGKTIVDIKNYDSKVKEENVNLNNSKSQLEVNQNQNQLGESKISK